MKCNKIIELVNYLNRFEQWAGRTVKFEKVIVCIAFFWSINAGLRVDSYVLPQMFIIMPRVQKRVS